MRIVILIATLILVNVLLFGQEKVKTNNSIRFGLNRAFFGSGDIVGPSIYGEYSYSLNSFFAVTPRIMSACAHQKSNNYFDHLSSFGASLSLRITPLPKVFNCLKLDFGGLYHKIINSSGNIEQETEYNESLSKYTIHYKEDNFGLLGSINVNVWSNQKLETGLKFDMLTSFTTGTFNCDSWQAGTYLGIKF